MAMNCPACTTKLRVVHTSSFDNITQRWYRCPECNEQLRTCETVQLGGSKRHPKGSDHPNAVLTEDDIRRLRRSRADGAKLDDLAEIYGINRSTVINIVKNRTWTHVS